jgi:hypothetical protein
VVARHVDSEIGQAVHLVYLPNTDRTLEAAEVDRLCELIGQRFPAATIQPALAWWWLVWWRRMYLGWRRMGLLLTLFVDV